MKKYKESLIPKMIVWFSLFIWVLTESLSRFHALTTINVRLIWGFVGVVGLLYGLKRLSLTQYFSVIRIRNFGQMTLKGREIEVLLTVMCFIMASVSFFLSVTIVPNNWDSMTYHLARVANWIENASVEYYPTNIPRQLYYSAFTEYFVLHICLLLENDLLVNLVQWFGYVMSAFMVYKIAIELTDDRRGAVFSALLFMMCPLAIAESMTTQIDLLACMWILLFAYFVLKVGRSCDSLLHRENIIHLSYCACCVSFGYLTKSSVCFMMLPFLLWLFIVCLKKKEKWFSIIKCVVFASGILIILLLPSFVRNYEDTGNIFAYKQTAGNLMMKSVNPKLLFLNTCKNLTIEMAGDVWPDPIWKITMHLADRMGVDIEDPQISAYSGFAEGSSCQKSYHHDIAGAQTLMMAAGVLILLYFVRLIYYFCKEKTKNVCLDETYIWTALCSAGVMFVCIRWQPWGNRLLLPALPMICIFIGYVVIKWIKWIYVRIALICLIPLLMFPDAYKSFNRQIEDYARPAWEGTDRFTLYFRNRENVMDGYKALIQVVKSTEASQIGLLLNGDTYEYPLWIGLKDQNVTIHPVVLEDDEVTWYPECIIAIDRSIDEAAEIEYGEHVYQCIWNFNEDNNYSVLWQFK